MTTGQCMIYILPGESGIQPRIVYDISTLD